MILDYAFDATPDTGTTMPVADGIHWLRMPLPPPFGSINLWLLEDDDGWAIVDTGIFSDASKTVWHETLAGLLADKPVRRVVVTHLHPDHVGCAGWLASELDVELWMTREEYLLCRVLVADTGRDAPDAGVRFYTGAGFPVEALSRYREMFGLFGRHVGPLPESYRRLQAGDVLAMGGRRWEVLIGNGHSPEHACLSDAQRKLFISGDQLLPTISSNVSVYPTEPHADPLRDWLDSLARLREHLPADVLVLPAHGRPFRGAHARIEELIAEHTEGLAGVIELCAERPRRALDVFPALFKSEVTERNLIMATGEAVAHLNYLVADGELAKTEDADGVLWYTRR
ncbi:MAG: MBL fold metallo-hydrolase [Woeseiaceae bacterium]